MKVQQVQARFSGSAQKRWYFAPEGEAPKLGDLIVTSVNWADVNSQINAPVRDLVNDVKVGQIIELSETVVKPDARQYLQLIPIDSVKARDQFNKTVFARDAARNAAREELNKLALQADEGEIYRALAGKNERAAELLKVLEG